MIVKYYRFFLESFKNYICLVTCIHFKLYYDKVFSSISLMLLYFFIILLPCCSAPKSSLILCDPMNCSTPGFPVLHYLPQFAQIHVHWINNAIWPSHPLPHTFPFAFNFPRIRVFSNESALPIRWPKHWSFNFNISPSSEYSGFISSRIDWFDRLVVQVTLKSLLQHHSSKAWILRGSAFFMVQLSQPYMTIGKTIVLNTQTFVSKAMSLLFTMLSRFVMGLQRVGHNWETNTYLLTYLLTD